MQYFTAEMQSGHTYHVYAESVQDALEGAQKAAMWQHGVVDAGVGARPL